MMQESLAQDSTAESIFELSETEILKGLDQKRIYAVFQIGTCVQVLDIHRDTSALVANHVGREILLVRETELPTVWQPLIILMNSRCLSMSEKGSFYVDVLKDF